MSSIRSIACAILAGTAAVAAHPVHPGPLSPEEVAAAKRFERRDDGTFQCPIFDRYQGGYQECTASDYLWKDEEIYGKTVTFYMMPNDTLINQATKDHIIDLIKDSTNVGLEVYKDWAPGIHINIGLVGEIPDSSYGWTLSHDDDSGDFEYCNVVLNFPLDDDPDKRLQKAVVHELYHCIQFALNGKQLTADNTFVQNTWWVEGSARFFDGVIYPIEGGRETMLALGTFPEEYNPDIPIVSQDYSAALFFHFLYGSSSVSLKNINNYITTKKGQINAQSDLEDIAGTNLISHNWHGFARTFVDNGFRYSKDIPLTVEYNTTWDEYPTESMDVGEQEERPYEIDPFTFRLKYFTIPKGTSYSITLPSGIQCSARKWKTTAWHPGTGRSFTAQAVDEDLVVEIVASCNKATTCKGNFVVEKAQ